jgi:hypothetical protein
VECGVHQGVHMRKNPEGVALDVGKNWTYRLRIVGFVDRLAAT